MKKAILVAIAMMIMAPAADAAEMKLSKGTMQVGGTVTLDIEIVMPDSDELDNVTGAHLGVSPSFGYFIMDNLELLVAANFGMGFGDLYDGAAKDLGFGAGLKYFHRLGPVFGYAGVTVGMDFVLPDEGDTTKALAIGVPIGVLWPLNMRVALDLGTVVSFTKSLEDGGSSFLNVPIGYLGVQAFF